MNELTVNIENAEVASNFKNPQLTIVTAEIAGHLGAMVHSVNRNNIAIAKAMAKVEADELYKEDGFESAKDYAMQTFGWKDANAYAYIQLGRKLTAGELPEGNFSMSQYREMFPLSLAQANEAISNGDIDPQMSAKDIREAVSAIKPKRKVNRKAKPEKRYEWYLDGVSGRATIKATVSEMEKSEVTINGPIKMESDGVKIVGYLVKAGDEIRFYMQGIEVPVAEAEAEVVSAEAGAEVVSAEAGAEENNG